MVGRIRGLRPRRVLEIGCKTGLLLFRLAPECTSYVGTDFTSESLRWLQGIVDSREDLRGRVQLLERRPDESRTWSPAAYDLVVLNSVVQYFPGIDYLVRVLERVEKLVAPGGRVLVADLCSLPLQGPLAASIELGHADDGMARAELLKRVRARMEREQELFVHPDFFATLGARLPRLQTSEILLKRGRARNELVQYRYDALLRFDRGPAPARRDSAGLVDRATRACGDRRDRRGPRARHAGAARREQCPARRGRGTLAARAGPGRTRHRERDSCSALPRQRPWDTSLDPEDFYQLGDGGDYSVGVAWSDGGGDGRFDAVFRRRGLPAREQEAGSAQRGVRPRGRRRGGRRRAVQTQTPKFQDFGSFRPRRRLAAIRERSAGRRAAESAGGRASRVFAGAAPGLHDSRGVRGGGSPSADRAREAGPPGPASASRDPAGLVGRIRGSAQRRGVARGRSLGAALGRQPDRREGQFLRARRALDAGRADGGRDRASHGPAAAAGGAVPAGDRRAPGAGCCASRRSVRRSRRSCRLRARGPAGRSSRSIRRAGRCSATSRWPTWSSRSGRFSASRPWGSTARARPTKTPSTWPPITWRRSARCSPTARTSWAGGRWGETWPSRSRGNWSRRASRSGCWPCSTRARCPRARAQRGRFPADHHGACSPAATT